MPAGAADTMAGGRMLTGHGDGLQPKLATSDMSVPRHLVQLRPGTVGIPFSQVLEPRESDLRGFGCDGSDALGLAIDVATGTISGVPRVAGDHRLRVIAARGAESIEMEVELIINADPKSLWREVEPPTDALFHKPHGDSVHITGDMLVVGASKRGRSHAHGGKFRDDHLGARVAGAWNLLAVADGAGSAALSRLGSMLAVEAALASLESDLSHRNEDDAGDFLGPVLVAAALAAVQVLDDRAVADGIERRALSTTLIIAAVRRIETGILTGVFGIGDGGAGIVGGDVSRPAALTDPDSGEFAGQTRFLDRSTVEENGVERVRIDVRSGFDALLLMTDGITDPRLPTEAAFADVETWDALWAEVRAAVDFASPAAADQMLAWLDFWSHGNHDDRTLLVLIP